MAAGKKGSGGLMRWLRSFKSRLIGLCAGAMCALKIDPSKLSDNGVAKLGQFIQSPKNVAREKGVHWNESKGTWEGKKGWAQQILATHHVIREIAQRNSFP